MLRKLQKENTYISIFELLSGVLQWWLGVVTVTSVNEYAAEESGRDAERKDVHQNSLHDGHTSVRPDMHHDWNTNNIIINITDS